MTGTNTYTLDNTITGNIQGQFAPALLHNQAEYSGAAKAEMGQMDLQDGSVPRPLHSIQQQESVLALAVSQSLGLIYSGSGSGEITVELPSRMSNQDGEAFAQFGINEWANCF